MDTIINRDAGIANRGNLHRMKELIKRAEAGERIVLAFLGGSITQGCLSSTPETCYAYLVYEWWKKTFPKSEFVYVNAGIGATTSQLGAARVDTDVLAYEPDLVIVEFSVNDDSTEFFRETYEGLVRHIYGSKTRPAMLVVHNVRYDDGGNAQIEHAKIVRHYQLPSVSMQSSIYPEVVSGKIPNREITSDDLHPNDAGHELVSSVITNFLAKVQEEQNQPEETAPELPDPITENQYEHSYRIQNDQARNAAVQDEAVQKAVQDATSRSAESGRMTKSEGFTPDYTTQNGVADCFKNGWEATEKGASIQFSVEGSGVAVQYRKTIDKPAPIARVVVDGDEENAQILDANFEETWGDCLYLQTILRHGEKKEHNVKIEIIETQKEDQKPFYLVSVIGSK